ncbi:MAG: hypothetical protein KGL39_09900 [Patescibacteria group bacterium]|nr:hypothetical protein [Patescibacteria group bacterium]
MNDLEKVEQHIAQIEAETKKARKELEMMKAGWQEWPKFGDKFYYLGLCGHVYEAQISFICLSNPYIEFGNAFKTREEAEKEVHARKIVAKLRQQPGARGFIVGEKNYCVEVSLKNNSIYDNYWSGADIGWQSIYFDTMESVRNAIELVGEENILKVATWLSMRK